MTWKDITLQQFYNIQSILEVQDKYMVLNLINEIYGIDTETMSVKELPKYSLEFLKENVPNVKLKKQYKLNNTIYDSNYDLTILTVSQYIDFTSYTQKESPKYEDLLSVFFVPKGHSYNDGYDMQRVKEDLLQLDICTVQTAAFFFKIQLAIFLKAFQDSLQKQLKTMNLPQEQMSKIEELLNKEDWGNLVLFLTSQCFVKKPMRS